MDFYAVLGIPTDADPGTIRSAYRILARRYHPDTGPGSSADKFHEIAEAYETLIDPARRQVYNRSLQVTRPPAILVEPTMARPEPIRQENPYIVTRSGRSPYGTTFGHSWGFDAAFDQWIASLADIFFPGPWRRR